MKYLNFSIPCAVVVGFFMTGLLLDVVQVSDSLLLVTLGTLVFTVLLFQRRLYEFALIALLIAMSKAAVVGDLPMGFAKETWLSLALAVVMLPVLERIMGTSRPGRF